MITKGIKVENKDCQLIYLADNLTCSLHHKKFDVIQFLTAHTFIINVQGQHVFDITYANELIKIFGMILLTYEKHLKENNSITSLKAGTQ